MRVVAYVDGACHPNPGPGGYGVVVLGADGSAALLASGYGGVLSTNNAMEIRAVVAALSLTDPATPLEVRCDSSHVVDGVNRWMDGWREAGWRRGGGGEVTNVGLWRELDAALAGRDVTLVWVRGHAGDAWNEMADELAVDAKLRRGRIGMVVHPAGHVTTAAAGRAGRAAAKAAAAAARVAAGERASALRAEARRRLASGEGAGKGCEGA